MLLLFKRLIVRLLFPRHIGTQLCPAGRVVFCMVGHDFSFPVLDFATRAVIMEAEGPEFPSSLPTAVS